MPIFKERTAFYQWSYRGNICPQYDRFINVVVEFYGGPGFCRILWGFGGFLERTPKKSCVNFGGQGVWFLFLIEKRIILFKTIITFFTIKIFKNLDNKNLNFFMRFFADFRRSTDNLPWKYRVPLTNQRGSFVLAFYFWIFKNPQKCVIFRDISMFFQWF